jgi:hypothetical protein
MRQTDDADGAERLGAARRGPEASGGPPLDLGLVSDAMTQAAACLPAHHPTSAASDDQLFEAGAALARLRHATEIGLVTVVAEMARRGLDCPGGLTRVDWLRQHHPGLTAAQAKAIIAVAQAVGERRWDELTGRVRAGGVTVGQAAQILGFEERLRLVADPEALDAAVADLTIKAATLPVDELGKWVRHHTETVAPPADLGGLEAARQASRGLWFDRPCTNGMVTGRFTLDPEGAAIVQSAIDPLSAPRPLLGTDGQEQPDPRLPATRRADALLEIIARGVASPGAAPSTDRSKVIVTVDLPVLEERVRGAGHTLSGQVLSATSVRRLACDAEVIPVVLGTDSAPLDVGRSRRLVPSAIRHAAWLRDGGCTYPGCTVPVSWCDAHHVTHWVDGGATRLDNTAMLCTRHHTVVHRQRLGATVTATEVTWHV